MLLCGLRHPGTLQDKKAPSPQPRLKRHPAGACAGRYSVKREQGLPVNPKPFAAKKIYSATLTTRYQQRQTFVIFALYKF